MKSRGLVVLFVLFFVMTFSFSIYAQEHIDEEVQELRLYPKSGSGLSQIDLKGADVTIEGTGVSYTGVLDDQGTVIDLDGKVINLETGDYKITLSLEGYKTVTITGINIPDTPPGLPPLPVEKEISLVKKSSVPIDTGGGGIRETPFSAIGLWGYVTIALIGIIVVLAVAILIAMRRRRKAYLGGAVDQRAGLGRALKGRSKVSKKRKGEEFVGVQKERFTGKHFGRYFVTRTIDRGGMAHVVEAEFEKGGDIQKAALKVPFENFQEDSEFINRFNQEAELGDILFHENIIELYEYGVTDEGIRFIAMELIEGCDLRSVIKREKKVEPLKAARIVMDIAKALDYAHSQSPPIYHRDIKPENIMFRDKKGQSPAILTDFGIATQGGTMGTGKALIGTAIYSCPDAVRGYPVSAGYDIYSLGVVFYEMLTGETPFKGEDYYTIMRRHEEEIPKSPRELNSKIPPELASTVLKMMEKNPKKRFTTTKELLRVLRKYLKG